MIKPTKVLTKERRKEIRDEWFKSLPRGDDKLPRDLELEAQRDLTASLLIPIIQEAERERIFKVIDEYGLDKVGVCDVALERKAKGWRILGEGKDPSGGE